MLLHGCEGIEIDTGLAIDLGAPAAAPPDQVRLEPDEGVAADHRAAFHGFEEEAVWPTVGKLEVGRNWGLQVGDQARAQKLRPAAFIAGREVLEFGTGSHGSVR
jgi:hypothetical protein